MWNPFVKKIRVLEGVEVCVVRVCESRGGCPCVSEEELKGTGAQGPVS